MNRTKEGISATHHNIRSILKGSKHGLKAYEICDTYLIQFKKRHSESALTARLREMRDVKCNLSNYRYSLES